MAAPGVRILDAPVVRFKGIPVVHILDILLIHILGILPIRIHNAPQIGIQIHGIHFNNSHRFSWGFFDARFRSTSTFLPIWSRKHITCVKQN